MYVEYRFRYFFEHNQLSKILGQKPSFLIEKINYLRKNPTYKFSKIELNQFRTSLKVLFGEKAKSCIDLIDIYEHSNIDIKEYAHQQWDKHNPDLKVDFFKVIDNPIKAYWFGFLCADGRVAKKGARIQIRLSVRDQAHLIKFCEVIGLDRTKKLKIRDNPYRYKGKIKNFKAAELYFKCAPMAVDLRNLGFFTQEMHKKHLPKFNSRELLLAWLLGFYDGDGVQGQTKIGCPSFSLLNEIKETLRIKNLVGRQKKAQLVIQEDGKLLYKKAYYRLSLGPRLLNEMMKICDYSLPRKREFYPFNESIAALEKLEEKIQTPEKLEKLIWSYRKGDIAKIYVADIRTLNNLIKHFRTTTGHPIEEPPKGYWKSKNHYSDKKVNKKK